MSPRRIMLFAVPLLVACGGSQLQDRHEAEAPPSFVQGSRVHVMPMSDPSVQHAATTSSSPHLDYYGGHVVSNINVVQVLYGQGSFLSNVTSGSAPNMGSFFQQATNSAYVDWLDGDYNTFRTAVGGQAGTNQHIGRGSFGGKYQITPAKQYFVQDSDIQTEINNQINAGNLPQPDANTYYALNFPNGWYVQNGSLYSCYQFCAYHGTFQRNGASVYYGVHPDLSTGGCARGCGGGTQWENQQSVSSHELIETVTDGEIGLAVGQPVGPPLAWYDSANSGQGEIGDICNQQHGSITGSDGFTYTVQKEWSNSSNACIVSK